MSSKLKVGIDLAPIAFRARAPGTATHVEHQARALLALNVDWEWILIATPLVLSDSPEFSDQNPIIVKDISLSRHASLVVGGVWQRAGCSLGLATAYFTPFSGPPVVTNYFDANSFHPVQEPLSGMGRVKSRLLQMLWARSRRVSRALFILSEYGRKRMTEVDPASAKKWIVAPCGTVPLAQAGAAPTWAGSLRGHRFILYSGAFSENKNQRRLIQAWDILDRCRGDFPHLVLIGPCPGDYMREVINPIVASTQRPEKVLIPGYVSPADLAWAFHNAHAYVQPSFAEGFGLPVVEAMSIGVPVACSRSTSLPEVAGGAALFFDPNDSSSIAAILTDLVGDELKRNELGRAGIERAKQFTWKNHASIVAGRIEKELRGD